jgi:hypothetical protein
MLSSALPALPALLALCSLVAAVPIPPPAATNHLPVVPRPTRVAGNGLPAEITAPAVLPRRILPEWIPPLTPYPHDIRTDPIYEFFLPYEYSDLGLEHLVLHPEDILDLGGQPSPTHGATNTTTSTTTTLPTGPPPTTAAPAAMPTLPAAFYLRLEMGVSPVVPTDVALLGPVATPPPPSATPAAAVSAPGPTCTITQAIAPSWRRSHRTVTETRYTAAHATATVTRACSGCALEYVTMWHGHGPVVFDFSTVRFPLPPPPARFVRLSSPRPPFANWRPDGDRDGDFRRHAHVHRHRLRWRRAHPLRWPLARHARRPSRFGVEPLQRVWWRGRAPCARRLPWASGSERCGSEVGRGVGWVGKEREGKGAVLPVDVVFLACGS